MRAGTVINILIIHELYNELNWKELQKWLKKKHLLFCGGCGGEISRNSWLDREIVTQSWEDKIIWLVMTWRGMRAMYNGRLT